MNQVKHTPVKPVLHRQAQDFLNTLATQGGPAIYELSPRDARGVLAGAQSVEVTRLPADIEDRLISTEAQGEIGLRIVRPQGAAGLLPAVLYFHGGGWVLGDEHTHDRLIREIANGANTAVVFVKYSRAPEARYPVALEESFAATVWVAEHGAEIGVDSSRLAVAGDSAGGNLAAAVTLVAKQRKGPKIDFQVLFYPVTDALFETPSYHQFAEGHFLTREAMKWFWNQYIPQEATRREIAASPLRAGSADLMGLPPALIITAEADVLRDEGEAYGRKLLAAGVPVTIVRYVGIIHDFVMLNALAETPATRAAIFQAAEALKIAWGTK